MNKKGTGARQAVRVLVVDDHPLVCSGLKDILNRTPDLVCCGVAATVAETKKSISELKPELVLLDLQLGDEDCLDLIKETKSFHPPPKVLVISYLDEVIYAERVLRAGGKGYLMKENATEEILSAIRAVLAGGIYVSQKISNLAVLKLAGKQPPAGANDVASLQILTDRELQVFQLLGRGSGTKQIAGILGLSFKTIESHRENIKEKLELPDASALVHRAILWVQKTTGSH
jgi:DNA-binding NarL/FixJ family response regulator